MAHNENGLLTVAPKQVVRRLGNPTRTGTLNLHHRTPQKLFSHPPTPSDVIQGQLGDCYLVSALNSILSCPAGPEAVEKCFLDRSSGVLSGDVVMRLYDTSNNPQYFAITKSVVTGLGAQHTIWVKLFEKGYAAMFLGGSYAALETASGGSHGKGSDVYRAVLGPNAELFDCTKNDDTFIQLMGRRERERVKNEVFGGEEDLVSKWWSWYPARSGIWSETIKNSSVYRLEDFERFLAKVGDMPEGVREQIMYWLNTKSPLPGRRGTGLYTDAQRAVYMNVRSALLQKKPVSAGTNQSVAPAHKIIGEGLAGEGKAMSGLVGSHAYSILDAKQDEEGLLWLQLENPWKNWGVKYERGVYADGPKKGRPFLKPRADPAAGQFWLELCDFTKHFKSVWAGGTSLAM